MSKVTVDSILIGNEAQEKEEYKSWLKRKRRIQIMAKKKKKIEDIKDRNSFFTAMMRRHPRKQVHKSVKRAKDAKNHWSKNWE